MDYDNYGGCGIKVCERWKQFTNFLTDVGEPPTSRHSLDRIKNDDDYCKFNCKWSVPKQQARNKKNNRLITHGRKTQCLAAWAEEYDMVYKLLWKRICVYNWSIEKALTTALRPRREVNV